MSPCCGRPNNRSGPAGYYERYAYLSSSKKTKQAEISGSTCKTCSALTMGNPCSVCGGSKTNKEQEKEEGPLQL